MTSPAPGVADRWVEHLRSGGTSPWSQWRTTAVEPSSSVPATARPLPGAQQLELLRRLNLAGRPAGALVDRVLASPAPGRGEPELDLAGAGPERRYGRRPVDPAGLPAAELVRVATGVLADCLAQGRDLHSGPAAGQTAGPAAGPGRPAGRRHLLGGRLRDGAARLRGEGPPAYQLGGDAWMVAHAREELVASGRPPGGPSPSVVLLAPDLATLLADAWTFRCCHDDVAAWPAWLRTAQRRATDVGGALPPRADLVAMARYWAGHVGAAHVHVVLDPAAQPQVLTGLLGVPTPPAAPPRLSAAAAELARRTGPALAVLVSDEERQRLLRRVLAPRLATADDGPQVGVPAELAPWVRDEAERQAEQLVTGGYALHGDPAGLVPSDDLGSVAPATPSDEDVLGVAVRLLLTLPSDGNGTPSPNPPEEGTA